MIAYRTGDILKADAEALVNTVNCVGIMGRGIALQFKKAFPANFIAYAAACRRGDVQPGRMFVSETRELGRPKYIVNFPTKRHWRGKSRIEDVEAGLQALATEIRSRGIRSIAIPPLGSGLGGLDWREVRNRIETYLGSLDEVSIVVYEPTGSPDPETMARLREPPKMTPGRAALIVLMHRYLGGLMDPFVSLLEVHKLMYFMQEAGQPLRLRFRKGPYGPYAENLRHVLTSVEGHLIAGYSDAGDNPGKQLKLLPGAIEDAEAALSAEDVARANFERVADLVEGFETPFGLELLSTVHWVAAHEGANNESDAQLLVYSWSDRKKRFNPRQIALAYRTLADKGWLFPRDSA